MSGFSTSANTTRFLNPWLLHFQKMGLELKCPLWYLYSSTLFFFFDCSLLLFFILTFLFPFLFLYEINSLNFFDDPILLPCNHLFCKYVFCFLILIWFLVFFFFQVVDALFFVYLVSGVACHLQLRLDRFALCAKQDLSTEVEFPLLLGFL